MKREPEPTRHPHGHPAHHPKYAGRWIAGLLAVTALYFAGLLVHDRAQERSRLVRDARHLTGGDPARGPALMRAHGCAHCHTIPGVPGSAGTVGPSLAGIASRMYVGGVVTNTPKNLVDWIVDPKAIDPKTAMPKVGVSEGQARDIAAYLYTLP